MSKDKKEKKDKRSKKDKKSKKRKREDTPSSSEDRGDHRLEEEANRITKALKKGTEEVYADDQGHLQVGGKFVWKKKIEQDLQSGARAKDIYEREKRNTQVERVAEIEKVKRRREEREREREERELENEQLQRDRAAAEAVLGEEKEGEAHLENAKLRSEHRLKKSRARPIDFLVRDLLLGDVMEMGASPPYEVFKDLTLPQVQDLREDLLEYQELDSNDKLHKSWWEDLLLICDDELREAEAKRQTDKANLKKDSGGYMSRVNEIGVHPAVDANVQQYLAGQNLDDLVALEAEYKDELQSGSALDPEFSSAVLKRLPPHRARAELREIHSMLLSRHRVNGKSKGKDSKQSGWRGEYAKIPGTDEKEEPSDDDDPMQNPEPRENHGPPAAIPDSREIDTEENEGADIRPGQWSPDPLEPEEYVEKDVITEEADLKMTQLLRQQALQASAASFETVSQLPARGSGSGDFANAVPFSNSRPNPVPQGDDESTRRFKALAHRSMGDINENGDAPFGGEVQMDSRVYWWHEKYRPRKPKYYNRVHTGYEWNKYNQTHYDHDNPPPKVVQGYKFNVFYPDLIDKSVAPEYSVEKDPEADKFGSTCILRFSAGPPYEDLTFRILNREWEYSHKKGYKCVYDRDTLYLYFNFKRQRYRR